MKRIKVIFVSVLTAIITLCGVIFAGCSDGSTTPPPAPPQKALSVKTIDNADSDEKTHEITATEVDGVPFTWDIAWENAASEWATGKTLSDYIEFTTDGYTATVKALQAFGERAIISATWGEGNEAYTLTKSVDYGLKCTYELSADETYYIVIGLSDICTVASGELIVSSVYNGCPVTTIKNTAFKNCTNITSITIPNSVTSIGDGAFSGCSNLVSIIIPNSVTYIGGFAFFGCSKITSITIPNSVISIQPSVFAGCSNLTSVIIPNGVTWFGAFAFQNCTSLTSITIPNSVTSIGDRAFSGCTSLVNVTFLGDKSNINIRETSFMGCLYQP